VLTNAIDRWYAGRPGAVVVPPPHLTPLRLRDLALHNRIAVHGDAPAGAGLLVTGPVAVTPGGRVHPRSPTLAGDEDPERWRALAAQVHDEGAALALRLSHAGRRGATRPPDRGVDRPLADPWPLVAPSAIPYSARSPVPQALDDEGLAEVREAFAAAAARAAGAGVDLLVLDAADGYLLASFLSPLGNRREDRYGGGLAQRMRFPLEVVEAVRAVWPEERPLAVRLLCDDRLAGGLEPRHAVAVACALRDAGCDLVDVASGWTVASDAAAGEYRRGYQVPLADRIRNEAGVPAMVGGAITTLDHAATILAAGRADLCVLDLRDYAVGRGRR
jgi:anthraniloyl-CoA monooxygenase